MKNMKFVVFIGVALSGCVFDQHKDSNSKTLYCGFERSSAEKGDTKALVALAVAVDETNKTEGIALYTRAAEAGEASAQRVLALRYSRGLYVEKNEAEAFKWFLKLAEGGDVSSQTEIASMYQRGLGTAQDMSKAIEWYTKAADNGNHTIEFILGSIYCRGKGVEKDDNRSIYWYSRAAAGGYVGGFYALGKNCEEKRDYVNAAKWYYIGSQKKDSQCNHAFAEWESKLTDEQLEDVMKNAESYVKDFLEEKVRKGVTH
jgi:TPR repeat protein